MTTAGSTDRGVPPPRGVLFQETLYTEPFWMLTACSLVNLTTWEQAEPAFLWLRDIYPETEDLALARSPELHSVLRPLGLWRRRALMLPHMAQSWLQSPPTGHKEVLRLPGCGKYASDSWAIFVEGILDVEPTDGKLAWYVSNLKESQNAEKWQRRGRHGRGGAALHGRGARHPDPAGADAALRGP